MTQFSPRQETVNIPQLASYFENANPTWTVRGLQSHEMAQIRVSRFKRRNQLAAVQAISSFTTSDNLRREMFEGLIHLTAEVEAEMAGRLEMLVIASVNPTITMEIAVKLSKVFPTVFWSLTDTISGLTDKGGVVGELMPSGTINV